MSMKFPDLAQPLSMETCEPLPTHMGPLATAGLVVGGLGVFLVAILAMGPAYLISKIRRGR